MMLASALRRPSVLHAPAASAAPCLGVHVRCAPAAAHHHCTHAAAISKFGVAPAQQHRHQRWPQQRRRQVQPSAAALHSLAPLLQAPLAMPWVAGVAVSAGVVGLIVGLAWLDARRKTQKPQLQYASTPFNERVLSACPALREPYRPLTFLTNGHVETIFAAKTRSSPELSYRREILHMADGGCVTLDWEHHDDPRQVCAQLQADTYG